jgi:hypothetical protein
LDDSGQRLLGLLVELTVRNPGYACARLVGQLVKVSVRAIDCSTDRCPLRLVPWQDLACRDAADDQDRQDSEGHQYFGGWADRLH